jgi:hypothetical protein
MPRPLNLRHHLSSKWSLIQARSRLPSPRQSTLPHKNPSVNLPKGARIDLVAGEAEGVEVAADNDQVPRNRLRNLHP